MNTDAIIVSIIMLSLLCILIVVRYLILQNKYYKQQQQLIAYKSLVVEVKRNTNHKVAHSIDTAYDMIQFLQRTQDVIQSIENESDKEFSVNLTPIINQAKRNYEISKMQYFTTFGQHYDPIKYERSMRKEIRGRNYCEIDAWFSRN